MGFRARGKDPLSVGFTVALESLGVMVQFFESGPQALRF